MPTHARCLFSFALLVALALVACGDAAPELPDVSARSTVLESVCTERWDISATINTSVHAVPGWAGGEVTQDQAMYLPPHPDVDAFAPEYAYITHLSAEVVEGEGLGSLSRVAVRLGGVTVAQGSELGDGLHAELRTTGIDVAPELLRGSVLTIEATGTPPASTTKIVGDMHIAFFRGCD